MDVKKILELDWDAVTTDTSGSRIDGTVEYEVRFTAARDTVIISTEKTHLELDCALVGLYEGEWDIAVFSRIVTQASTTAWSAASNIQRITLDSGSTPVPPKNLRIG